MADGKKSTYARVRDLKSYFDLVSELAQLEDRIIERIRADLEAGRQLTIERLLAAGAAWDIAQAQAILAEIERQQSELSLVWAELFEDALREALERGSEMATFLQDGTSIEVSVKPFISTRFLEVSIRTMPDLIRGVNAEFIAEVGRMLRLSVLGQRTPFEVMQQLGQLPPLRPIDPKTLMPRPWTAAELRAAMANKGPYAKLFRRMEAIMRTEIGRIAQTANYLTLRELARMDPHYRKEWVAVLDNRVRDDHAAANGQRRLVDEPFEVGGEEMQYPHDPRASAAQTINCRCISLPWHPIFEDPKWRPEDEEDDVFGYPSLLR